MAKVGRKRIGETVKDTYISFRLSKEEVEYVSEFLKFYNNGKQKKTSRSQLFRDSGLKFIKSKTKKDAKYQFTDSEIAILKSIPEDYKYIQRDAKGNLILSSYNPKDRSVGQSILDNGINISGIRCELDCFNHIFQAIKCEDVEYCEFRKYL